jgi:RNA recognition motif-containing protein
MITQTSNKPDSGIRLFIRGIPFHTTKDEIQELCSRFGKVTSVDVIPQKQFGFVTFSSKEEATLAVYGIQQQIFKGTYLQVDWAKKKNLKKDEKDKDSSKNVSVGKDAAQGGAGAKKEKGGNPKLAASVPTPAVPEVLAPATPRYIPGDEEVVESPLKSNVSSKSHPSAKQNPPKNAASKKQTDTPKKKPDNVQLAPIPKLTKGTHYPEDSPALEISIRDTNTQDMKYTFRVKSLSALKKFLQSESGGNVNASDLFNTSVPKNDKNVFYGGLPVVHVYEDLLGKEIIEPRENKESRETFLRGLNRKKDRPQTIPESSVPLSSKQIPVEELYHLLASKGYESVILNTSADSGPLAPLHPSWKPLPNTYTFRKGGSLVVFTGQSHVETCEFLNQSTNQTYKDLLPLLTKYDVCIFNFNKGAFIAPEQLQ